MAFPTDKTNAVDNTTDVLASHLNNIEDKVGLDDSADADSLDYRVGIVEDAVYTWKGAWVTATVLLVNWLLGMANLEVIELYSAVGATGITPTIGASITNLIGGIGFLGVNFQNLIFLFLSSLAIVVVGTYAYDWVGIPKVTKEWQKLTAILVYGTLVFMD